MSFRLASYAVCLDQERVLLVFHRPTSHWTLPGGGVEHGEDPIDTVIRELREEAGLDGRVERLLGVDSRVIPGAERLRPGPDHHNVGVFYEVDLPTDVALPEVTSDEIGEVRWVRLERLPGLRRSSLVEIGLNLAKARPLDGHVPGVPVGGLVEH